MTSAANPPTATAAVHRRDRQTDGHSTVLGRLPRIVKSGVVLRCVVLQDRNVYRYYRDLINFRQKGDPAVMLRCINPSEAKLIDAAAGVHVKFRLAGVSRDHSDNKNAN